MNILINGLLLNRPYTGVQYSIESLIEALSRHNSGDIQYTVLVSSDYTGRLEKSKSLTVRKVKFNSSNRFKRIAFENFFLFSFFKKHKFDIYHSPGYTLPVWAGRVRSLVTLHDLIALDFPELCKNETALYYNLVLPGTIYSAKKIVAVSNKVKDDVLRRFPVVDENKIAVIYHGVNFRFKKITIKKILQDVRNKYNLPERYLLFVGNIEPKKNIERIVEALHQLKSEKEVINKLVIVGRKGWKYSSLFKLIEKLRMQANVILLGYVEEEDLPAIYSLAETLVYPSLYEGFGLPVIEAMACGCPVVMSNRGALPEISNGLCQQIDPLNTDQLCHAIRKLMGDKDYRNQQINDGIARSSRFSWDRAANQTIDLYNSIMT